MPITISAEKARGCGYRKAGGMYLVSGSAAAPCGLLPLELCVCPTCGAGIRPSRAWTWVNPSDLVSGKVCGVCGSDGGVNVGHKCEWTRESKSGLMWIGEMFYKTADDFMREAAQMGISRRIHSVPRGFVVGKTWILLAHRNGLWLGDKDVKSSKLMTWRPAVFAVFKPQRIDYILKGTESQEEMDKLEKRGFTLIQLKKLDKNGNEIVEVK